MRKQTMLVLAVAAALMLCSASVASAALPVFLVSTGSLPVKFSATSSGKVLFEVAGSFALECLKTTITGEVTSTHGGTYKIDIEGCQEPLGFDCHTSGDAKGVLLWSGEFHFVRISLMPTKAGMLMSVPALTSSCLGEFASHENKGFVFPITPINTFTTSFSLPAKESGGVQETTSYYNEAGTLITGAYLQVTTGPKQFGFETTVGLTTERSSEIQA